MTDQTTVFMGEQQGPINALVALATEFPTLPIREVAVRTVLTARSTARGILIALHTKTAFADFEMWREALGIAPAEVRHEPMGTIQTLRAYAVYKGVAVELVAYTPLYAIARPEAA